MHPEDAVYKLFSSQLSEDSQDDDLHDHSCPRRLSLVHRPPTVKTSPPPCALSKAPWKSSAQRAPASEGKVMGNNTGHSAQIGGKHINAYKSGRTMNDPRDGGVEK